MKIIGLGFFTFFVSMTTCLASQADIEYTGVYHHVEELGLKEAFEQVLRESVQINFEGERVEVEYHCTQVPLTTGFCVVSMYSEHNSFLTAVYKVSEEEITLLDQKFVY